MLHSAACMYHYHFISIITFIIRLSHENDGKYICSDVECQSFHFILGNYSKPDGLFCKKLYNIRSKT